MRERGFKMSTADDPNKKEDGAPASDTIEISDAELAERMERLKAMGRTIGNDFAMKVVVGRERGWRYKFKPVNTIEVDPEDVKKKGLDYCFGVIAHEGAHRRVSRVDFIPKEVWQATGFSFLMNAIEDPRVNNWVKSKYGGVASWLEQVYSEDLPDEEKVAQAAKEKLGYTPKHIRYGLEVIRHWHKGNFGDDVPPEVREVLDKTIASAEQAYESMPGTEPSEEEIKDQAELSYKIIYSRIWPEYQKLVEEARDQEALRQMIKDLLERGEMDVPPEAMSEESDGETEKTESGKTKKQENKKTKKQKGGKVGEPLPLDEMPEEVRKEIERQLKEKLDAMSDEERDKAVTDAEEKAKKMLDELETDLDNDLRGKFSEQLETKTEERERTEREQVEAEIARKRQEELDRAKAELDKQAEAEKNDYERVREEVKPYIDKVAEDLMNVFIAKRFPKTRPKFPGQRARLKGGMAYDSQKNYKELFEGRLPSERPDYSFLLLVDLSGSMRGEKIEETFKATVLFAEALSKVAETIGTVKVAVYGFQDVPLLYKGFDTTLDDAHRLKMDIMKSEVHGGGEHNRQSYNNDGYCVDIAADILRKQQSPHKFLVVLSDGLPEGSPEYRVERYSGLSQQEELKRVVQDISAAGTEHVAKFYRDDLPNVANIPNVNVRELVEVLAKKIEEMINQ